MSEALSARLALMFGNLVVGVAVLAPAGMLNVLADGLGVSVATTGLLITWGAAVLCFASPLVSWLTSGVDRRLLHAGVVLIIALGNLTSVFAPNYAALMAVRLVMVAAAAVYTPQAASTIALIVPPEQRPGAIAFVFLGWTLAVAAGLPVVAVASDSLGWRVTFAIIAVAAFASFAALAVTLPGQLRGVPVSLSTWSAVGRNRLLLMLLAVTAIQTSGQFALFTYLGPLAIHFVAANAATIGLLFAVFGVTGFVGNLIATRLVVRLGTYATACTALASMMIGILLWAVGVGWLPAMLLSLAFVGLGFAAMNSMQQARLYLAAPPLAGASVALNTSTIYVGQAVGSALGGFFLAHELYAPIGYAAALLLGLGAAIYVATHQPRPAPAS